MSLSCFKPFLPPLAAIKCIKYCSMLRYFGIHCSNKTQKYLLLISFECYLFVEGPLSLDLGFDFVVINRFLENINYFREKQPFVK